MKKAPKEIEQRRKYDKSFKLDAINRVIRTGKTCAEVGRELGVSGSLLAKWRHEYLEKADQAAGDSAELTPSELAEELRKTRRELEDVRQQRDILKKALGIFSRQSGNGEKS